MYPGDQHHRPAPSTPLQDYLASARTGVDRGYVVLPRALLDAMPPAWQQQMIELLSEYHRAHAHLPWPVYRVTPCRHELMTDLDEGQLAEVGAMVEIDADGDVVYRDRLGRPIAEPETKAVLVSCLDPLVERRSQPSRTRRSW
jgi:hypothetical protein